MEILSALTLGVLTSFHCAGMCGPIALALPLKNDNWVTRIFGAILYNLGRSVTYAILGFVFGLAGQGLVMSGFQQWVSIIMGLVMVLMAFFPAFFKSNYSFDKKIFSFVSKVKAQLGLLFGKKSYGSLLTIGLLNGLLPCGPLYIALAAAIATGGALNGSLFMFLFGLATIPVLLAISLVGNLISINLRKKITRFIPYTVFFIGILFILRGLQLGIPFLSPPKEKMRVPDKNNPNMGNMHQMKTSQVLKMNIQSDCSNQEKLYIK